MRVNASCTAVLLHISSGKYARMVKAIDDFAGVQHTYSDAVYKCCRSEETLIIIIIIIVSECKHSIKDEAP